MSSSPSPNGPADPLPKKNAEQLPSEANFADDVFQSYVQELWEAYSESWYGPDSNERVQSAISQMIELLNNFSLIAGDLSFVSVDAKDMYQLWELSNRLWPNHSKQARSLQKCLEKCAGRLQLEQSSSALITSNKSGAGLLSAELGYIAPVEQSKHLAFCVSLSSLRFQRLSCSLLASSVSMRSRPIYVALQRWLRHGKLYRS
jgi:hypothetical protein